jgi:hypothetical protein
LWVGKSLLVRLLADVHGTSIIDILLAPNIMLPTLEFFVKASVMSATQPAIHASAFRSTTYFVANEYSLSPA